MPELLARWAYISLLWLLTPFYVLRLWRRGRVEPLYRQAIGERFGFYAEAPRSAASDGPCVWVHAVSLGETRAASALIDALRAELPGMRLLLTTGTATGREAGRALLTGRDRQAWLPWDTPGATRRFIERFQPDVGVLMETELWPNLLRAAQAGGVAMVLANARLSERSLARGRRAATLLRPAVRSLRLVLTQAEADATRLRAAGAGKVGSAVGAAAETTEVAVMGNLKYDLAPDPALLAQGAAWHALLMRPVRRSVVLAAVTREGEEAPLLAAWQRRRPADALLVIVPRHPQRFDAVATLVEAAGLTLARRSRWRETPPPEALAADVWLGDSMGEMPLYYASADVALLGGSFAPFGGQNLIEAAACGRPVVMGPSTFNFEEAAKLSLAAGASLRVADIEAALARAEQLLAAPERLAQIAQAALAFAGQHRGAAVRMARRIVEVMRKH